MNTALLATAGLYTALGALLGYVHFRGLRWNLRLYTRKAPAWMAAGTHALRLLLVAAVFVLVARQGAVPLLACLGGLLIARSLLVRAAKVE